MAHFKRFLMYCFSALFCTLISSFSSVATYATSSCSDFYVIFARGSGQSLDDIDHKAFSSAIKETFARLGGYSYQYYQLGESNKFNAKYPAIGIEQPKIITGAILSGGQSFEFGQSVKAGMKELKNLYQKLSKNCPSTRLILAGYSQGAMVISQTLQSLNPHKIFYYASFGDPKLYLPEGAGLLPPACRNKNFSPYRENVPDCYVEQGLLGGLHPYIKQKLNQKVGVWCNIADFICGSNLDPFGFTDATQNPNNPMLARIFNGHVSYSRFGAYKEAAEVIYRKILREQKLANLKLRPIKTQRRQHLVHYFRQDDLRLTKDQVRFLKSSLSKNQLSLNPNHNNHDSNINQQNKDDRPKDLHIMIPNLISYHEDSRIQLLINKIINAAYQNHCGTVTFYSYGFFNQAEIDKYRLFYQQNSQSELPNSSSKDSVQKEGIIIGLSLYVDKLTPFSASNIIGLHMKEQRNIKNINIPKLINSSIQNVISHGYFKNSHQNLFFIVTPNFQKTHSFDNPNNNQIQETNKQINQKLVSVSFYNTNQDLSSLEKILDTKHIFSRDQTDEKIVNTFYKEAGLDNENQLENLLQPRFDSIGLDLREYFKPKNQDSFLINSPTHSQSFHRTRFARALNSEAKSFDWHITQDNRHQTVTTINPILNIPIHSISHIKITVSETKKETGKDTQNFDLHFLPKPEQNITLFPYRLIIIDNYIAGFTNQKHLIITNLSHSATHQVKVIEYNILGRKVSEKITIIPKQNKQSTNKNQLSKNLTRQNQSKEQGLQYKKSSNIPLVPDCGTKYISPVRPILYYTQYF